MDKPNNADYAGRAGAFRADMDRWMLSQLPPLRKKETVNQFNMACPSCENETDLSVTFTGTCKLTHDGSEDDGDHEWDNDSRCRCGECGFEGQVQDFDLDVDTHEYLFDLHLVSTVRIKARTLAIARHRLETLFDCCEANFGATGDGEPLIGEVNLFDQPLDINPTEIDGEPI